MSRARGLATAAIVATAVVAAGCGSIAEEVAEEAAERAVGGEVEIDEDSGSVTIENDEGTTQVGAGSDLPDALPEELPLPDGLEVLGAISQESEGVVTAGFQAVVEADYDATRAFFDEELEARGWTVVDEVESTVGDLRTSSWQIEGFGVTGVVSLTLIDGEGEEPQLSLAVNVESTEG